MVWLRARTDLIFIDDDVPAAPRALEASYYAGAVTVTWELAPAWNGEAFRVYSRRLTDSDLFFIAEVTSCIDDFCSYVDTNVTGGETYVYIVSAVSPNSGIETDSDFSVEVFVPLPTAPPIPDGTFVIALDDANYIAWGTASRSVEDFSFYKVYQDAGGEAFLLGETDSEGFLDLLATNGETFSYFVTAVDSDGHESDGSVLGEGTPRPDFHGEWLYAAAAQPDFSGFRFAEDEDTEPILAGTESCRALPAGDRCERVVAGARRGHNGDSYRFPDDGVEVRRGGRLPVRGCGECSVVGLLGSGCPTVHAGELRAPGRRERQPDPLRCDPDRTCWASIKTTTAIMIFDWAYQIQAGNPNLATSIGG